MLDYTESFDYTLLSGYNTLLKQQRQHLRTVYSETYHVSLPMGIKIAQGKAFESAKAALREVLTQKPKIEQEVPPSIFAGLSWV